jgi:hypothetical protein
MKYGILIAMLACVSIGHAADDEEVLRLEMMKHQGEGDTEKIVACRKRIYENLRGRIHGEGEARRETVRIELETKYDVFLRKITSEIIFKLGGAIRGAVKGEPRQMEGRLSSVLDNFLAVEVKLGNFEFLKRELIDLALVYLNLYGLEQNEKPVADTLIKIRSGIIGSAGISMNLRMGAIDMKRWVDARKNAEFMTVYYNPGWVPVDQDRETAVRVWLERDNAIAKKFETELRLQDADKAGCYMTSTDPAITLRKKNDRERKRYFLKWEANVPKLVLDGQYDFDLDEAVGPYGDPSRNWTLALRWLYGATDIRQWIMEDNNWSRIGPQEKYLRILSSIFTEFSGLSGKLGPERVREIVNGRWSDFFKDIRTRETIQPRNEDQRRSGIPWTPPPEFSVQQPGAPKMRRMTPSDSEGEAQQLYWMLVEWLRQIMPTPMKQGWDSIGWGEVRLICLGGNEVETVDIGVTDIVSLMSKRAWKMMAAATEYKNGEDSKRKVIREIGNAVISGKGNLTPQERDGWYGVFPKIKLMGGEALQEWTTETKEQIREVAGTIGAASKKVAMGGLTSTKLENLEMQMRFSKYMQPERSLRLYQYGDGPWTFFQNPDQRAVSRKAASDLMGGRVVVVVGGDS